MAGPHPYPKWFDNSSGHRAQTQNQLEQRGVSPIQWWHALEGLNAMGDLPAFVPVSTWLSGIETAGKGIHTSAHAAQSTEEASAYYTDKSFFLQENEVESSQPPSRRLDYPGIGPEHAWLYAEGRAKYISATDEEALSAAEQLSKLEGILPALETAHAFAALPQIIQEEGAGSSILVCLSGRGDKDMETYASHFGSPNRPHRQGVSKRPLLVYLTAGSPTPQDSSILFQALVDGGADILEIGVPFSDPGADGPAIQRASERALASGATLKSALTIAAELPKDHPKVLFGYLNPFLAFGYEALAEACLDSGIHGVLCVDCPPEEENDFRNHLEQRIQSFGCPNHANKRIELLSKSGGGLLRVSAAGVTGGGVPILAVSKHGSKKYEVLSLPVAGFGIRSPENVRELAPHVDAVVVGSALVRQLSPGHSSSSATARSPPRS